MTGLSSAPPGDLQIDETHPEDAAAIQAIARDAGVFDAQEITTVAELLSEYDAFGAEKSGYHFLPARVGGRVAGFACFGPRPLTRGTYDLYWIVVSPEIVRRGVGGALLERVVERVGSMGGRLLVAETSSRGGYAPARLFYATHGFICEAVVAGFYDTGDDLVMYIRRLGN